MVNVAVAGLGKMGLSHLSVFRAHPDVTIVGVCDSLAYLLDVLGKYTGIQTFTDYELMLEATQPDAVVIATPTHLHADMVRAALRRDISVFCEKPLALQPGDGTQLADEAYARGLVTQVGYHNRYIASFAEAKRLLDLGAIGRVTHAVADAYGPVVLKAKGSTWRSRRATGGGCLYDYAAHPIDLLTWYFGRAEAVSGSTLGRVFSAETEDEVYGSIAFAGGISTQLSVNWSDESQRKMSTSVTIWGTAGRINAERQEIRVFLRDNGNPVDGYRSGWNVRYTTDLTTPVWFYLRGEEYSAQVDDFVRRVRDGEQSGINTFGTAAVTDEVIDLLLRQSRMTTTLTPSGPVDAMAGPVGDIVEPIRRRRRQPLFRRRA
jgi:predicted dehydrogenase